MTTQGMTESGVPGLGDVAWGSHFCHFFGSREDLGDILVPYLKTGLEQGEACLWITSEALSALEARAALSSAVPDIDHRERRGQIQFVDHGDWYTTSGAADAHSVLAGWRRREQEAHERGFSGLRVTGDTLWVERKDRDSIIEYESLVNDVFRGRRVIALCSYCSSRCSAQDVLDVVRTHQFAVSQRCGEYEIIESAALRLAREDLLRVQSDQQELRRRDRYKNEFISMIGHELRNPLAPLQNSIEVMRMRGAETAYAKELGVAERQIAQLRALLEDLLDVAGVMRDRIELDARIVDLGAIAVQAVDQVGALVEERSQRLRVDVPDGLWVRGDARRLVQVLTRLLANSIRYTPELGKIELTGAAADGAVTIAVRDDGPGIPPELGEHLFDLFAQGARASGRGQGGLGVGLPIVKRIVELHGGSVSVGPASGGGAEFVVSLPSAPPDDRPDEPGEAVLVVDDNVDAASAVAEGLEILGHRVVVAHDGAAALELVEHVACSSAIVDLELPDMDGCELALRLRARLGSGVKLVALTGHGQRSARERTKRAGFDEHLVKPASLDKIHRVLGSHG